MSVAPPVVGDQCMAMKRIVLLLFLLATPLVAGEFDYLLGDWEFSAVSKDWGKGHGYWSAINVAGGAVLDEYRLVGDKGETYYVSSTLRVYNKVLDQWELVSAESGTGLQN